MGQRLPVLLLLVVLSWYGLLVVRFQTHGALGDDPATYVLMARDLVTKGTVTHEFPLFTNLFDKGLSWYALVTPGYHVVTQTGFVAPNFAFGLPLLLVLVARLIGEGAFYWATPLMGGLALAMTYAVGNELSRDQPRARRYLVGALAVLLLATTPKQIELVLAPMSDVPTQLFSLLAIWCALRMTHATRRRSIVYVALCGISLGVAYLIRHSALILVVPLAFIATRWGGTKPERIFLLMGALAGLAVTMLPDIVYRANVLGSVLAVESPESSQLVLSEAPRQFFQILVSLVSLTGLGPIVLLAPFGGWVLTKNGNRFAAWILASWIFVFVLFHTPLKLTGVFENDLRYLLPAYPALALSIAVGTVWILTQAWAGVREVKLRFAPRTLFVYGLAFSVLISVALAARAVASPERFAYRAYGWMSETTRGDLDALSSQLPPDAVIGVSDQLAGATLLYAHREIFRPANFLNPASEFPRFFKAMQEQHRQVYFLGSWNCSHASDPSELLPVWVGNFNPQDMGMEIRDLPYECSQRLFRFKGD